MKILITGGTGFIGKALVQRLNQSGNELVLLTRDPQRSEKNSAFPAEFYAWDSLVGPPDDRVWRDVEAVVHLAGESISTRRWSETQKAKIYESRVFGTQHLIEGLKRAGASKSIKTFISGSAVGFYGNRGEEVLTEDSVSGTDFLARVCRDWEKEVIQGVDGTSIRSVQVRTGMVLGRGGGALETLLPVFKIGLGGPVGTGRQWMSWIHIQDWISMVEFSLSNQSLHGPVNAVSPHAVRNEDFSRVLSKILTRPAFLRAPRTAVKLILGELSALVLSSQHVFPKKLVETGFQYAYPEMSDALGNLIKLR